MASWLSAVQRAPAEVPGPAHACVPRHGAGQRAAPADGSPALHGTAVRHRFHRLQPRLCGSQPGAPLQELSGEGSAVFPLLPSFSPLGHAWDGGAGGGGVHGIVHDARVRFFVDDMPLFFLNLVFMVVER